MNTIRLLALTAFGALFTFGCEAGLIDEVTVGDEPVASLDTSEAALMSGNSLTGSQCTTCGCTLEATGGSRNGCPTYRCVCDTEAEAACVTGKMSFGAMSFAP